VEFGSLDAGPEQLEKFGRAGSRIEPWQLDTVRAVVGMRRISAMVLSILLSILPDRIESPCV